MARGKKHTPEQIVNVLRQIITLIEEQVRKRRLRALNLRGEHRFFANIGIEEERKIGQE